MSTQVSFIKIEKEFLAQFREKINTSEDIVDVQKYFSYTIKEMLQKILKKEGIKINEDDIQLLPNHPYYTIKNMDASLKALWENSDIKDIIQRFAETAHKRYLHLQKNPAKTQKKIRP